MRQCTNIHESQFGVMPGRSTTDAIFILKQTIEKRREGQKNVRVMFIDLEKTYRPAESLKSMRWRHDELLWLIRHLGPFLSQNQADASLASLMNFLEAKSKLAACDYVLRNIFAPKPLRNTILVSTSMLSGSINLLLLLLYVTRYFCSTTRLTMLRQ